MNYGRAFILQREQTLWYQQLIWASKISMIIASNFQFHHLKTSYSVYVDIKGLFFSVEPLRPTFWKWSSPYNGNSLNNDYLLTNATFQQCPRLKRNIHLTTPTSLWRQPFHNVSVTWVHPNSRFKDSTDRGCNKMCDNSCK